jgi:FAD:protein FMN transferase
MHATRECATPEPTTRPWRLRAQPLLGTLVEISAPARNDAELRRWSEPAFERIAALHAAMSFHSATSDLSAIARARAGHELAVRADTWRTLALALELEDASLGHFNCAVAPTLVARGLLPRPADASPPRATSARAALTLLSGHRVRIEAPLWIDLGGLAKGVAVDAAVQAMRNAGAPAGMVNAGGDLRVFGNEAREIVLRDPAQPQRLVGVARVIDGAVATSAGYFLSRSALVDACGATDDDTVLPVSVTVFAPSCAVADGLTKVLALRVAAAEPLLRRYHAKGLCIDREGRVHHV